METNGKGIFYGVIGVATLIVAIIGATFAYFTASGGSDDTITGQTATASSVSVAVAPVYPTVESGKQLGTGRMVPLDSTADMTKALAADSPCIDDNGYVACQVYKITVSNQNNDPVLATTELQLTVGSIANMKWQLMNAEGNAVDSEFTAIDSHAAASTVKASDTVNGMGSNDYYVVIWLENNGDQTTTDSGKTFTGTVTSNVVSSDGTNLSQLQATFTAQG